MTIVVLDANAMNNGLMNAPALARLQEASAGSNTSFVVPDPVLWEWTEHAMTLHNHAQRSVGRLRGLVDVEPIDPISVEEMRQLLERMLYVPFEVWKPISRWVEDALIEQTLVRGACSRKGGVKTGIVDELVLKCVEKSLEYAEAHQPVLLWSSDRRMRKECLRRFPAVELVRGENEIFPFILRFADADHQLESALQEFVSATIDGKVEPEIVALQSFGCGGQSTTDSLRDATPDQDDWLDDDDEEVRHPVARIRSVSPANAAVSNLRVAQLPFGLLGSFDIDVHGVAQMELLVPHQIGRDEFEYIAEEAGTRLVHVKVPFSVIAEDETGHFRSLKQAGMAQSTLL